ncbi:MAG: thioesterase family protein [Crocinitomicaceae bacterium]|nr:thioesterase family protein [Crocinitomicaceae bacterium]MDG1776128.1 thioesterase family protein [Crocinitomicaceae bacterium]
MKIDFNNSTTLRVRYSETDQMGYCYYGNYAQYFEVGRVEALRSIGMSYKSLEDRGIMLPVSDFQVTYKTPAKYDDQLTIQTKIIELKGARLIFNYTITNKQNKLIATSSTTLVFVSKETMRPIAPPKDFLNLISAFEITA